jgi:hypothetical protein
MSLETAVLSVRLTKLRLPQRHNDHYERGYLDDRFVSLGGDFATSKGKSLRVILSFFNLSLQKATPLSDMHP